MNVWIVEKNGSYAWSHRDLSEVILWFSSTGRAQSVSTLVALLRQGEYIIRQDDHLIEMRARPRGYVGEWSALEPMIAKAEGESGSELSPDTVAYTYGRSVEVKLGIKVQEVRWQHHCGDGMMVGGHYVPVSGRR